MNETNNSARSYSPTRRQLLVAILSAGSITATQAGCIPMMANLIHAVRGAGVPAEFDGLEEKKVAVVTITDSSSYTDDSAARLLNRYVVENLLTNVKKIKLVREDEVDAWRDTQGMGQVDYLSLGRGVECEKLVAIEMTNLRLREGQTMYRGHADVTVMVHDIATNSLEFRRTLEDYTYPVTAALPVTETTEEKFRRLYLNMLAHRVSRYFYEYDFRDSVADDAKIVSF